MTNSSQNTGLVALADRLELWPVERLRPYDRNPRTHSDDQVAQIAASMVEFGWTNPILIDETDGILAGHGRLQAAKHLGLSEVPVVQLSHLSEAQKRAYVIADNQLALQAGWDEQLLAEELSWLRDHEIDLDIVGFDEAEIERLLALADGETAAAETEDEAPELPEEPITRRGDLWIMGDHRLLCGDATILDDVERVLDGRLADLTYNVDYANTPKDKLRGTHRPILNDNLGDSFEAFLYDCPFCLWDWTIKRRASHCDDEGHQLSGREQQSPAPPKLDEKLVHLSSKRDACGSRKVMRPLKDIRDVAPGRDCRKFLVWAMEDKPLDAPIG